jgi:hypothetical protein
VTAQPTEPSPNLPAEQGRPPWLTRNVKVLCGVSFLQDTASELLYPVLPIFLTTVLGAPVAVVGMIEGNRGGRLLHVDEDIEVILQDVLVSDNQTSGPLIDMAGSSRRVTLKDSTLAGNVIGSGNAVFNVGSPEVIMRRSILWQPGRTLLQCSGCDKTFERIIASERVSLDGGSGTQVVVADPRFVESSYGDYRLRAGSPAVDYVPATAGDDLDVLGLPRDVKLPIKIGAPGGTRDIGAFERQTLQPLVINSDVDADTQAWETLVAGAVSRDPLNASGPAGSGSLKVSRTSAVAGQAIRYARQCVHLPGPARYSLNGWGRAGSPGGFPPPILDTVQLRWELRHNGGEDCISGSIAGSGALTLSSGDWRRPTNPAVIDVESAGWTSQSSLVVYLVVIENDPERNVTTGWFDGITLDAQLLDDVIFADGFE